MLCVKMILSTIYRVIALTHRKNRKVRIQVTVHGFRVREKTEIRTQKSS